MQNGKPLPIILMVKVWLAENLHASTVGITISPVQLEIARKFAEKRKFDSKFLLMDAENMQFEESFDVIRVLAATTYFHDPREFIKKALKHLKSGGKKESIEE